MKASVVSLIFLLFCSCKFAFSPYTVETPKLLENQVQLRRIAREEPSLPADYRIAFIADTHNYYDDLADQVEHINRTGPFAFVVVNGDITNEGHREEYLKTKEILDRLNYPYLVVVGNHDLLSNGEKIYTKLFGPFNFVLQHRDLTLVFTNNNNWEIGGRVPDFTFIDDELAAAATPRKVLVAHVPPDDRDRFTVAERERLKDIIITRGVDYIISGHNHNAGENVFAGATQVTVGSSAKRRYMVLSITAGGLGHQKVSF